MKLEKVLGYIAGFILVVTLYFGLFVDVKAETFWDVDGFAYQKVFSNNDFRQNENRVALNGSLHLDIGDQDLLFYGQVATNRDMSSPVSRLAACLPISVHEDHEGGVKFGKFSRVLGFHNDVSDAPSSSRMGLLPQAPYNDLFLTSSFATMEKGAQVYNTWTGEGHLLYAEVSIGEVEVGRQESIQPHLIGTYLPNMTLESNNNNWAVFSRYENVMHDFTLLAERSYYELEWSVTGEPNVFSMMVMAGETEPFMYVERVGLEKRGLPFDTTFSAEHYWLTAYTQAGHSKGYYAMLRKDLDYSTDVFVGYTRGIPNGSAYADDRFIGASKDYRDWFFSLEYHDVESDSWSHNRTKNTNSWLATAVYRF